MSDNEESKVTPEQLLQVMDAELLAEIVGRELLAQPDAACWRDERFLAWLRAEMRVADRGERRLTDEQFMSRGVDFMVRARCKQLRLRTAGRRPHSVTRSRDEQATRPLPSRVGPIPVIDLGIAAGVGRELWDEPTDTWIELPRDVPDGEYVALAIVGNSMAPVMHTGDTVLVRMTADVQRGTVVVARHPEDGYVCKRVASLTRESIELASLEPGRDPIFIPRDAKNIVGQVILVWCQHRG
jgi:SOS-response transcriptional repressor LexA